MSGRRAIAMLNGSVTVGYLVLVTLAWPVLALTGTEPTGQLAWLLAVLGIPVLASVLAWGSTGGWIVLGMLAAFIPLLRTVFLDVSANIITNDVQALSVAVLFCALSGATLNQAQNADAMALAAREASVREAAAAAKRNVEVRAQALVHDEVLATLGFAARASETMRPMLAAQAREAREQLGALALPMTGYVLFSSFVADLEVLARSWGSRFRDSTAPTKQRLLSAPPARVPASVAAAMTGAVQQSLVNSKSHAAGSTSTVVVTAVSDTIHVEVSDDGPGFDPSTALPGRLGIAVSIVARLRMVGGDAKVRSRPGMGTTIRLSWSPATIETPVRSAPARHLSDRDTRLVGVLLAAGQLLLAVFSLTWQREALGSIVAGIAIATALVILSRSSALPGRPVIALSAVLIFIAASTVFTTHAVVPHGATGPTHAGLWPLVGGALVLGVLCLRGRPGVAVAIILPLVALAVLAVVPGPFEEVGTAIIRAMVIVSSAAAFAIAIRMLAGRVERARAIALHASTERAWVSGVAAQARERFTLLDAMVGPLLARIAEGVVLTEEERKDCLAFEGALRDDYRAGRLRSPVVAAAADRARRRGVDVVLIDDVPDRTFDDAQRDALDEWLESGLDAAVGSFMARVLPVGRRPLVTAASEAGATHFGG